jgi:glutamate 5-kinase
MLGFKILLKRTICNVGLCPKKAQRVVIKVGSTLVTNHGEGLDQAAIHRWAKQITELKSFGKEILVVSSGAIAEGMQRLQWKKRPQEIYELQAAAAVGQMGLIQVYETAFMKYGIRTAQVLLTNADLANEERNENAKGTLNMLLKLGVVPIINENDTVVTDEIKFGDNDTLAALVCNLIAADVLVILTDQHGLYSADPRKNKQATLIQEAVAGDSELEQIAGGVGSDLGKGGMLTKVLAAKLVAGNHTHTVIASGNEPDVLLRLAQGELVGTQLTSPL